MGINWTKTFQRLYTLSEWYTVKRGSLTHAHIIEMWDRSIGSTHLAYNTNFVREENCEIFYQFHIKKLN